MEPTFWLERWTKNEIGFHQAGINPYLQKYWSNLAAPPGSTVFVPMCGKSMDMRWLRQQGYRVLGVELAKTAVKDFFAEQQLNPTITQHGSFERWEADGYTLLCGDFFALTTNDLANVTTVFDRASLIAMPPAMREQYAKKIHEIVSTNAMTLLVAITYPQQEMRGPPFAVSEEEVRRLYANHRIEKLLDIDVLNLEDNARFKQRGMTQMSEQVYRIER